MKEYLSVSRRQTNYREGHQTHWRIMMQVNCSINHVLNQSATDEEIRLLISLLDKDFFQPNQREVVESFVSRKSIENFLNTHRYDDCQNNLVE